MQQMHSEKRSQQYLFLSLFLVFALLSFYISFDIYLEGSDFDKKRIKFLSKRLEQNELELQIAKLEQKTEFANTLVTRGVASIDQKGQSSQILVGYKPKKNIDLVEFYFLRAHDFQKKNKMSEALIALEKVKKLTGNLDRIAQAEYEIINIKCDHGKLTEFCIETLDGMVLQYPDSEWTGLGLLWLTKVYKSLNRGQEAKQLVSLLKSEFPNSEKVKNGLKSLGRFE